MNYPQQDNKNEADIRSDAEVETHSLDHQSHLKSDENIHTSDSNSNSDSDVDIGEEENANINVGSVAINQQSDFASEDNSTENSNASTSPKESHESNPSKMKVKR